MRTQPIVRIPPDNRRVSLDALRGTNADAQKQKDPEREINQSSPRPSVNASDLRRALNQFLEEKEDKRHTNASQQVDFAYKSGETEKDGSEKLDKDNPTNGRGVIKPGEAVKFWPTKDLSLEIKKFRFEKDFEMGSLIFTDYSHLG